MCTLLNSWLLILVIRSSTVSTIKYEIPTPGDVVIQIYNIMGEEIFKNVQNSVEACYYFYQFDAIPYSSGIYFYQILHGDNIQGYNKMVYIK